MLTNEGGMFLKNDRSTVPVCGGDYKRKKLMTGVEK